MKYNPTSRRMFLQTSGGLLLGIPFLSSLTGLKAQAATVANAKYLQITNPLGAKNDFALPPSALLPATDLGNFARGRPLSQLINTNGQISGLYGNWWNEVAPSINIITGIHGYVASGDHNASLITTASGTAVTDQYQTARSPYSVDWVLEKNIYKGATPSLSAVRVNLRAATSYGVSHCMGGEAKFLPCDTDYSQLQLKLGGSYDPNAGALSRKAASLNSVMDEYKKILAHRRLSAVDRARFQAFVDSMADIQRRDSGSGTGGKCTVTSKGDSTNFRIMHENALEMLANAYACGVTRVGSYVILHDQDAEFNFESMHNAHHNNAGASNNAGTWRSKLVAGFVKKAAALTDETGESMLKNMVVYWGTEFSDATDPNTHNVTNQYCVLAGGAAGRLKTGNWVHAGDAPINRVLVTIFQAMGLTSAQYEQNGSAGFGEYTPDRPRQVAGAANVDRFLTAEEKRKPLPLIVG